MSADYAQLYRIAKRYYIDGKLQSEIAREEGVSRSFISKLLTQARECGIARVELYMPENHDRKELERRLKEKLHLDEVFVTEAPEGFVAEDEQIQNLCVQASPVIYEMIADCKVIGVGWGRTLYRLAQLLEPTDSHPAMTFIPLIANGSIHNRYLQVSTVVSIFADRFLSGSFFLNSFYHGEHSDLFRENIQELHALWDEMECAIFSLSPASMDNSYFTTNYKDTVLDDYLKRYPNSSGEMLAQVFFEDGPIVPFQVEGSELISFPIGKLKSIRKSICIATGEGKAPVIINAARQSYFNRLITDIPTAIKILEL